MTTCSFRIWLLIKQNDWNESFRCFIFSGKVKKKKMTVIYFIFLFVFPYDCHISFTLNTVVCIQMGVKFSPQYAILFSTSELWDEILHIQLPSCFILQSSHALSYAHLAEAESLQTRILGLQFLCSASV